MKSLIFFLALALSTQAFSEEATCRSQKAVQSGKDNLKASAEIRFTFNREEQKLNDLVGHIFVQSAYAEENAAINIEDSYMGFFKMDSLTSNRNYRPNVYKGFTQFKEFNAVHTTGQESGMWGELLLDLRNVEKKFEARYVFQAGDHMGGTVLLTCRLLK